jgi:hypothetical protein
MNIMKKKMSFGLIVGTRGFFNPKRAQEGRKQLIKTLDSLGYPYVILQDDATANGAMTRSRCADIVYEAISKQMKREMYRNDRP